MPGNASRENGLKGGRPRGTPSRTPPDVKALAQAYTAEAIDVLVAIMRDPKGPYNARAMAARELLDRGHGRPAQAVTGEGGGPILIGRIVDELHP